MSKTSVKLLLLAVLALAALGWPSAASAQRCTQGYDIGLREDRNPSLCAFFTLPAGEAGHPIAAGPDGAVWFFVADRGLFATKMSPSGGQTQRYPMPPGAMPSALTAGPDGALWYAGDGRIGRMTTDGQISELPVPAPRATGIVSGPDGALWVAAGSVVLRVTPQGAMSAIPAASGASHGIAVGGDGALWVAGGSSVTRVTTDGRASRVSIPGDLPADGGIAAAADGSLWYSSGAAAAVGRIEPGTAQVTRFRVMGRPVDLVRGPGSANLWVATQNDFGGSWITRMATRSFGPGRPKGWSCRGQNPAACWFRISRVPLGDVRRFDAHGTPRGVTVGPDGNIWYTEGRRIGRIMPFRGAMPCYQRVTRSHNFGCGFERSHTGAVTNSGAAYIRTTCPYLTFRLCHGDVVLRLRGGRLVGRAGYLLAAYDTPRVRVPLPRWMLNRLKRQRRVKVDATYTSEDMGGIKKVNRGIWFLTRRPDRSAG